MHHSTLPVSTLRRLSHLCDTGGAVAAQAALAQLAIAAGFYAGPVTGTKTVPACGYYDPDKGIVTACPHAQQARPGLAPGPHGSDQEAPDQVRGGTEPPVIAVTFYRSYLTAADTAPIDALIRELRSRGFMAMGLFVPSLKNPQARDFLTEALAAHPPVAIVNATAFSGRGEDGTSPLDTPGCPVFQVALSTARQKDWATSERGLSPADLAMHVVLPEVDGRLFTGVVSFKAPEKKDPHLQFSRFSHRANAPRIKAVVDRIAGWHRLATTPAQQRKLALVLSTYPGRADQIAHAVGLDALASTEDMLLTLASAGYAVQPQIGFGQSLPHTTIEWPMRAYEEALRQLPDQLREDLQTAWGDPTTIRSTTTAHSISPPKTAATRSSPCNPNAAASRPARRITTTLPASPAIPTSPFTSGSGRRGYTRWFTSGPTARWNGSRANPSRCPTLAGPRR